MASSHMLFTLLHRFPQRLSMGRPFTCAMTPTSPANLPNRQFFRSAYITLPREPRPSVWDPSVEPEGPTCHCGDLAVKLVVQRGHVHNMGREFFGCRHPLGSPKNCGYFAWADGTVAFGPEAWKRWGETHSVMDWKEAMRNHWASKPNEEVPEAVKRALEDSESGGQ
jgi:hypothetical protein